MSSVVAAERLANITANATVLQPVEITIAAAIVEQLTEDAAANPNVSVEIGHLRVSVSRLKLLVPIV